MNSYLAKEIRLLLPAYVAALVLAIVPVWLLPRNEWNEAATTVFPFGLAVAVLALSSFGREFSMATFSLLLAQPVARPRVWWTKVAVLAVAVVTVLCAWWFSCVGWMFSGPGPSDWWDVLFLGAMVSLALFSGGLWSTLLVRQVTAAFWFTVFIPAGMAGIVSALGGTALWICGVLSLYSAAGFVLAWRLFRGAQEAMWTGGTVALSGWGAAGADSMASSRSRRPFAALLVKELQLQQVSLMGMAGLLLVHLGVVMTRKVAQHSVEGMAKAVLDFYPFLWVFVPLLVGSLSVAEERRLGTMEAHLGLPVSSRIQFVIKFLFVLVLGGFVPLALLLGAEWIGTALGAPVQIGIFDSEKIPIVLASTLLALSFISFYASTLTRNLLQSLAVSVVLGCLAFAIYKAGPDMDQVSDMPLWRGPIFHLVAWPILIVAILALDYGNFRRLASDLSLWRRNAICLAFTLAGTALVTASVYHRAWESAMPLEPAHGPARLTKAEPPVLRGDSRRNGFTTLLPNGTLRVDAFFHDPERAFPAAIALGNQMVWMPDATRLVPGSNWVDAFAYHSWVVGIRSDGTLWGSEKPVISRPPSVQAPNLVRFGSEANWLRIVKPQPESVWLLKKDGTLWTWQAWGRGDMSEPQLSESLMTPKQIGNGTDWAKVSGTWSSIAALKTDGSLWRWRAIRRAGRLDLFSIFANAPSRPSKHNDWVAIASVFAGYVSVAADGSLWYWPEDWDRETLLAVTRKPTELGSILGEDK